MLLVVWWEVTIKIVGHPDHGFAINPNLVLLISPPSVRKSTQEAVMFLKELYLLPYLGSWTKLYVVWRDVIKNAKA